MKRKCFTVLVVLFSIGIWAGPAVAGMTFSYQTIDDPLADNGTWANGISGNNIVGYYSASSLYHGFLYNGTTWTTLDDPLADNTYASGISGNNIVGYYRDAGTVGSSHYHGFLYNGTTWTTLDDPLGVKGTYARGIDGNNVVGFYFDSSNKYHGFLYDGFTYTTLDDPLGVNGTHAYGISGSNIVGDYNWSHGFLYNGSTYTTIDDPLTYGNYPTGANGISGSYIVGGYANSSTIACGYLYDGTTWTTLREPKVLAGGGGTYPNGISGGTIVGTYDGPKYAESFIATIITPEPSTFVLLTVGAVALIGYRWRRRRLVKQSDPNEPSVLAFPSQSSNRIGATRRVA